MHKPYIKTANMQNKCNNKQQIYAQICNKFAIIFTNVHQIFTNMPKSLPNINNPSMKKYAKQPIMFIRPASPKGVSGIMMS